MSANDHLRLTFLGNPTSVHVQRWMLFFARRGHEVSLLEGFGLEVPDQLARQIRVERYRLDAGPRVPVVRTLHLRRALRQRLERLRPDVLHAHFVSRYGWHAALSGFHPYVVSAWGSDVLRRAQQTRRGRWKDRLALRNADLVTVVSRYMAEAAVRAGAREERIEIVQHGVDVDLFAPGPPSGPLLATLGLGGRPYVFSPRAVHPLYRHEIVIQAFARLPGDLSLLMSARGADPAYLGELRGLLERLGVSDRVRIVDDLSEQEMAELYRGARAVVSVPESDSFPISLLEAMACAAPVVASDLPPARAILGPLLPDLLVPVGDVDALAAALRRALSLGRDERERIGARLRSYVQEEADQETHMLRMEAIYRRLASGTRP